MKNALWIAALAGSAVFADPLVEGKAAYERHEYVKAAEAFNASCNGGDAAGCLELGKLYESGSGVAQNPYRASSLYAQACRGGEALGCSHMGVNVTP